MNCKNVLFGLLLAASFSGTTKAIAQSSKSAYVYQLQMNDSLDVWNDGQWLEMEDRKAYKTKLYVYNKCKGHRGATGKFVIDFRNKGPKDIVAWVMLVPGGNEKYKLEPNNAARISLKPGEKESKYLELRGCWGKKGKDDQQKCKSCEPKLVFYELNIL